MWRKSRGVTPRRDAASDRGHAERSRSPRQAAGADNVRDERLDTDNWYFVDLPLNRKTYDLAIDCKNAPFVALSLGVVVTIR